MTLEGIPTPLSLGLGWLHLSGAKLRRGLAESFETRYRPVGQILRPRLASDFAVARPREILWSRCFLLLQEAVKLLCLVIVLQMLQQREHSRVDALAAGNIGVSEKYTIPNT